MNTMRKVVILLLTITLTTITSQAASQRIVVKNESQFLSAIGSNRVIIIEKNVRLNLSTILEKQAMCTNLGVKNMGYDETTRYGNKFRQPCNDGYQLVIKDVHNLTIEGRSNSEIVVDPRYAVVMTFKQSEGININNLTIGHTNEGYCQSSVLRFENCNKVTIEKCDLYGCGTYGIEALNVDNLLCQSTIIHDCSYGIMELRNVNDATFRLCDFVHCRELDLVIVDSDCQNIVYQECRFANNSGTLFSLESPIKLNWCDIYHSGLLINDQLSHYLECNHTTTDPSESVILPHREVGAH